MEPRKYTKFEDGINNTHVNLSALWTINPTMATQLGRDELDNKSDSSGNDI